MSRVDEPATNKLRQRQRANTTGPFQLWRRPQQGIDSSLLPLSLDDLILALTPPAVPSLSHARSLAAALSAASPLPKPACLNPVLASLCDNASLVSFQAAGYDILSAYCENHEVEPFTTAERLTYFSLFTGNRSLWAVDLWEPRFKALRALTKFGSETIGIETGIITVSEAWILAAFEGLITNDDGMHRTERTERERCIDLMHEFLQSLIQNNHFLARISDDTLFSILQFYGDLVDRSMQVPLPLPLPDPPPSSTRPANTHKRHTSSISISSATSIPSPTLSLSPPPPPPPPGSFQKQKKHPFTLAVRLYTSQLKSLPPTSLQSVLPLLFRALSFCATTLPRLSLTSTRRKKKDELVEENIEQHLTDSLSTLLSGPYATTCMRILQKCLYPQSVQISYGAHRTLRMHIRRTLHTRLARAYINREASFGYSHSGAPVMDLEREVMESAWPRPEEGGGGHSHGSGWDAGRLGKSLSESVRAWVECGVDDYELVLEEAAGTLKDILQELDTRDESKDTEDGSALLEDEEATAVGQTLLNLVGYVKGIKTVDDSFFILPLAQPSSAPSPLLRVLSSLLSTPERKLNPPLSTILLSVADHLSDNDTARIPDDMLGHHELSPTTLDWLDHWKKLLGNESLMINKPLTRKAITRALQKVFHDMKDMKVYRRPLVDLARDLCQRTTEKEADLDGDIWNILGEEIVLRTAEDDDDETEKYLDLLIAAASLSDGSDDDGTDTVSLADHSESSPSPVMGRIPSDSQSPEPPTLPSLSSLLSSLTNSGHSTPSRQQRQPATTSSPPSINTPDPPPPPVYPPAVHAVCALINVFCRISCTPLALEERSLEVAFRVWDVLIDLLSQPGGKGLVRITVLSFIMRLRADRDHRVYWEGKGYDADGQIAMLAGLIGKNKDDSEAVAELRKARAKFPYSPQERDGGRKASRGLSRSRSRVPFSQPPPPLRSKPRESLWRIPEQYAFVVTEVDTPSGGLQTYDPDGFGRKRVLPVSKYLSALIGILENETNWEVLSYVLCHLPVQMANKHLFCGPKSRVHIASIQKLLCNSILDGEFAAKIDRWPAGLKMRDAHGLAYHTLSVLVSYRRCLDGHQQHRLVEVFRAGLDGQPATIRCSLHALSVCAFELRSSTTKFLSDILEKLSQIMSNPDMAVHILGFLSIIGSHPPLYANFTEGDFKMVFGVALQYLQHYNKNGMSPTMSWALSQHVRILSYYLVYVWFLALKLPDRPRHVRYITRQLLLASEGNKQVDDYTEVCFDWLARYTYASADPRPATSTLSDIVMNPTSPGSASSSSLMKMSEKTWVFGNSVMTVRTLKRLGWFEVLSRRPSGYSRFLCRLENAPLVGPGDVDPDTITIPASLLMDRELPRATNLDESPHDESRAGNTFVIDAEEASREEDDSSTPPPPDPITGYVWSGTAPSQRRKDVAVDPAFFALQLSAYPDRLGPSQVRMLVDPSLLPKFYSSFDRIPVIDTHKVGILYAAPGQTSEVDILRNTHGSPAYTRFLEGIGRLINLRGQLDVYAGGLNPDEDGEYAYAWWDDIGQILYHAATMMPTTDDDPRCDAKKRHIGNDYVRIVWNDSGMPYRFDTLSTEFQFVNIVVEPHSLGAIAAFSNNIHENEYFKVTVQRAEGMPEFAPVGEYKLISAENLPFLVRQLSLLADWFASVFSGTDKDTSRVEITTNWQRRLQSIRRFRGVVEKAADAKKAQEGAEEADVEAGGVMGQEVFRDFTSYF